MGRAPGLSKSRFQAGLQCPKYLWLRCHRPELADPVGEALQAVFDNGQRVGALARERCPGGVLLTEDYTRADAALATTERLLEDGASCLYEAAFQHDGVFVRPDVIRREDGLWDLVEVKSTTQVKEEHLSDLAIQAYVLRGAGLPLGRTYLMHLNRDYVYEGGPYDLAQLFTLEELTAAVEGYLPAVPDLVTQMKRMLVGECPERLIGRHCHAPYDCGFLGLCHAFLPDYPVTEIPRLKGEVLESLLGDGIYCISEVPRSYPGLSPLQRTVCEVVRTGEARYEPGLGGELSSLGYPLHFLDFETTRAALPLYPGTRPYQVLPVQWSCHTLRSPEELEHAEFLHCECSDPRRPFAESLLASLPREGAIVVYTSYENTVLKDLAVSLPDLAPDIAALQERLFDLEKVVRTCVQHPDFHGRTSLKFVLPALVDDLSYEDLAIQNGEVAMLRYEAALHGDLPDDEREQFTDLCAYCATDTLALVRLFQTLRHEARIFI